MSHKLAKAFLLLSRTLSFLHLLSRFVAIFIIATLTFFLMKALPGDPFNEEQALPREIHESLKTHYGLDQPIYKQYFQYLTHLMQGNLGPSFRYKERLVNQIILESFPISATLGFAALSLAVSLGILLGTVAALKEKSWQDHAILLLSALGISVPSFILATLLQYLLGIKWGLLPIARLSSLTHMVLPALSLAALPTAYITRMVRSSLLEVLQKDYIKTARAKGISEWQIVFRHGFRNAFFPVVTYLGPLTANILVGSFVIEKIFAIPGLGQIFVTSVLNRDYTVIMGTTLFYSLILLVALLIVDIAYLWLDPRVKPLIAP